MDQFESGSLYEVMKSKYERWAENVNSSEMDSSLHPSNLVICDLDPYVLLKGTRGQNGNA